MASPSQCGTWAARKLCASSGSTTTRVAQVRVLNQCCNVTHETEREVGGGGGVEGAGMEWGGERKRQREGGEGTELYTN